MRIFLDVGSHHGETIKRILKPVFKIGKIYSFEPSPTCYDILQKKFSKNKRVTILNSGLWNETCNKVLYYEGTRGATIFSDYTTVRKVEEKDILCSFVKASDWFRENLKSSDDIFLKLNCEGCECDIVNDLLDSGEFRKVKAVLIDYDVRKSPSQSHKQKELEDRLAQLNIKNVYTYMGEGRIKVLERVLENRSENKMTKLMIAVTSANNITITRDCLNSIPIGPKVVVYDDASTEPIEQVCSELKAELKKEDKPKGLTNLWNRAYQDFLNSDMDVLLLTNNDVIFPKGSIEEMFSVFTKERPVILGPLTNRPGTGINQRIGMYLCNVTLDVNDPANVQTIQAMLQISMPGRLMNSNYINGFCFMLDRSASRYRYDKNHLFPPQKINIGNEDWLCGQIRRRGGIEKGRTFIICLKAFVFHYKALTTRWCKDRNRENLWR